MIAILIILASIVAVGVVLYIHERLTAPQQPTQAEPADEPVAEEQCCGLHIACEKDSLSTAASDAIVYYDDEELDRFKGKEAESYRPEEIEEFRDVLLTMLPSDIAGWARSLQLRDIQLPVPVRDELLLIVAEARQMKTANR